MYAELKEEKLPVYIVVDYSFWEEPVIVTSNVPNSRYWIKYKIRKKIKILPILSENNKRNLNDKRKISISNHPRSWQVKGIAWEKYKRAVRQALDCVKY